MSIIEQRVLSSKRKSNINKYRNFDKQLKISYNIKMERYKATVPFKDFARKMQRHQNAQVGVTEAGIVDFIYRHNTQVRNLALNSARHGGELAQIAAHAADSKTALATIAGVGTLPVLNGAQTLYEGITFFNRRDILSPAPLLPTQESRGKRLAKGAGKVAATAAVMIAANKGAAHIYETSELVSLGAITASLAYLNAAKHYLRRRMTEPQRRESKPINQYNSI
jgi:hypothetical protein